MCKNALLEIPESLIESARLDGASHFTILAKIVVPLSKPIMATIALFYAVGRWNAYSDALYYIKQNVSLRPLQLKLYYLIVAASESFQSEGVSTVAMTNPEVLKAACIIFAAVPIICVYPFIQKYFVQGTMVGVALKIRPLPEVETGREGTQTPKRDAGRRKRIPQRGQLTHNFMKHCRQERLQKR